MKLRYARHCRNLHVIKEFYLGLLNMTELGSFQDHEGYSGVFLGYPDADWHLEFTTSEEEPVHTPDPDDALVLYPASKKVYSALMDNMDRKKIIRQHSRNPYWQKNGIEIRDPEGFSIIIFRPV